MSKQRIEKGVSWISEESLQQIVEESCFKYPLETGGILMGYVSCNDVIITDVIGPGPNAGHKACSFEPDYLWQELQVALIYSRSGQVHTYLGDWHSHPDGSVCFSKKDKATLRKISQNPEARMPFPIMAILSLNESGSFSVRRYVKERSFFRGTKAFEMDVKVF